MDMKKMMQQAKKMQAKMNKMQEEMEKKTVEATAGGGVVKVKLNGKKDVIDIEIDEEAVDPDDVEMLEDLLLAAINEGMNKVQDMIDDQMGDMTGGMDLPGMF